MDNKTSLIIMSVTGILIIICGVIGATYAWFSTQVEGTGELIKVTAGVLEVAFTETTTINVSKVEPIYDTSKDTKAYKNVFSIYHDDTSNLDACYKIELVVDSLQDKFKTSYLKWELYSTDTSSALVAGDFSGFTTGGTYTIKENISLANADKHNYEFRVWFSYSDTDDQTSFLQNNSDNAMTAHLRVTSTNGLCQ